MNVNSKRFFVFLYASLFLFLYTNNIAIARTDKIKLTEYEIEVLHEALTAIQKDIGRFPATKEGLRMLVDNINDDRNWRGPYMNAKYLRLDSWGNSYIYLCPAQYSARDYDLYSFGPNGIDEHGLGDDIANRNR